MSIVSCNRKASPEGRCVWWQAVEVLTVEVYTAVYDRLHSETYVVYYKNTQQIQQILSKEQSCLFKEHAQSTAVGWLSLTKRQKIKGISRSTNL